MQDLLAPRTPPRRRWEVLPPAPADLARHLGAPPLWARLLHHRGITTPDEARAFLKPDLGQLHDPFLLSQMDRAVQRILSAAQAGATIGVYGDFDTDGVTATALLLEALGELGARAVPYLPHRVREGHGLNVDALRTLQKQGASLLVTVDTGISAVQETHVARDLGMEVIITDHHASPAVLPEAYAVITPRQGASAYPNPYLTGAGLAFKLAQGLYQRVGKTPTDAMLELAALGTVADMAPLVGENRVLAWAGLEALRRTRRPGLQALLDQAGVSPDSLDHETIPFILAPRLNAAGRIDSADLSLRLLTCASLKEAQAVAAALDQRNHLRQGLTEEMLSTALQEAQGQAQQEALLFLASEEFVPGVNGLVAAKLVEAYYRPAVVVSLDGELARGSARSIPEFDLARALAGCTDLLLRFGGHPAAAGFLAGLGDLPVLRARLQTLAREKLAGVSLAPRLRIDAEVAPKELLGETFGFLRALAPFGQGNPPPVFLTRGVQVAEVRPLGNAGRHLGLTLRQGGALWEAVAFRQGPGARGQELGATAPGARTGPSTPLRTGPSAPLRAGLAADVVYSVSPDASRGRGTVQLQVLDLRLAGDSP